jgi:hypothetical protein
VRHAAHADDADEELALSSNRQRRVEWADAQHLENT